MKETVVACFESPLMANEAVRILQQARFDAERLPRISRESPPRRSSVVSRFLEAVVRKLRDFMDADMYLQPYASALARGQFVVKVYAAHDLEVAAARRILEIAGGAQIDVLADEWVES